MTNANIITVFFVARFLTDGCFVERSFFADLSAQYIQDHRDIEAMLRAHAERRAPRREHIVVLDAIRSDWQVVRPGVTIPAGGHPGAYWV